MKTILVDAIDTLVIEGEGIYKSMYDLLEKYPNRKIILTNANDEQMVKFGLNEMPYEVFTLKHNPDKVDPLYFKIMFEQFRFNSEEVIYFEHNIEAVKSAELMNINTFHYDSAKKDVISLEKFLESNLP